MALVFRSPATDALSRHQRTSHSIKLHIPGEPPTGDVVQAGRTALARDSIRFREADGDPGIVRSGEPTAHLALNA